MIKKSVIVILIFVLWLSGTLLLTSCSGVTASEKSLIGTWKTEISAGDLIKGSSLSFYNFDSESMNVEIPVSITFEDSKNAKFKIDIDSLTQIVNDLLNSSNIDTQGIDVPYIISSLMQYIFKDVPDDAGEFKVTYSASRKLDEIKLFTGELEIAILEMDSNEDLVVKKGFVGEGIVFNKL